VLVVPAGWKSHHRSVQENEPTLTRCADTLDMLLCR
jgi:hypothetical protein